MVIDWTASTGRRLRQYEVETGKSGSYFGCAQTPVSATVSASGGHAPRMVVIGDSYNAGSSYGPWLAGGSIAQLLGKRLGWRDTWNMSVGGTGYLNASASTFSTFGQRVPQALALSPDIVLLMGSSNDVGYAPMAVQAEVASTLRVIRAGTSAPIVVIACRRSTSPVRRRPRRQSRRRWRCRAIRSPSSCRSAVRRRRGCSASWNNAGGVRRNGQRRLYVAADNVHPPEIGFVVMRSA